MIFIVLVSILLLVLGIVENSRLQRNIDKIKIRILVNGTRGKSSTVRLLVAALNNCGIKTIGKSTGSEAFYLLEDGTEESIDRHRGVNIVREQKKLFKLATSRACQAVVCECQAVREENQALYANKVFCPTLVAITNIRADHQDVMGDNPKDVIFRSVPKLSDVIVSSGDYSGSLEGFNFKSHPANIELALSVCEKLGLDKPEALEGMKKAKGDIGHISSITIDDKVFINGFAVNDSESARELFTEKCSVVYSNRSDREYRIKDFNKLFKELGISDIKVIGDNSKKCAKILGAKTYDNFESLVSSCSGKVICCGNIVGSGRKFLEFLLDKGEKK